MTRKGVQSITLYGFIGSGNIGNDATFDTVASWISARFPSVALRCATIAPESVRQRYGIPSRRIAWAPRGAAMGESTSTIAKAFGRLVDIPRSLRLAGWSDATLVPGMGVLESTLGGRPWGMPLWLFLMALSCRLRGRRFVLLDVGADRAFNLMTRMLNLGTVRLASHVSFRDRESALSMSGAIVGEPQVVPDLVYAYPRHHDQPRPEPGRLVVGVMAYYGPADDPVGGSAVRTAYVEALTRALTVLTMTFPRIVLLGGDRVDLEVAEEIRHAIVRRLTDSNGISISISGASTFAELSREMAKAEVIVASRYHNLICGLRMGQPCVSIGYAAKSRDLMREFGVAEYSQDIDDLDADRLIGQVSSAREHKGELAARLALVSGSFCDAVESFLSSSLPEALGLSSRPTVHDTDGASDQPHP